MTEPTTLPKLLVTAEEAATMLAMGKSTLWRKVKEQAVPAPVKVAGFTRWRVADLAAFVAQQASQPTSP